MDSYFGVRHDVHFKSRHEVQMYRFGSRCNGNDRCSVKRYFRDFEDSSALVRLEVVHEHINCVFEYIFDISMERPATDKSTKVVIHCRPPNA